MEKLKGENFKCSILQKVEDMKYSEVVDLRVAVVSGIRL